VFDTADVGFVFTDVLWTVIVAATVQGCRVVNNNNMPPDTTIAAASEKNTVRIT